MEESMPRDQFQRPVSRRGAHSNSSNSSPASRVTTSGTRPGTGAIRPLGAVRTPSSNMRMGTASRIATAMTAASSSGTGSSQRIGTALGLAGSLMAERPITQHGLSGLPTSHGRIGTASGMRMVKDKRYWQAVLQTKMNEITQETTKLLSEKHNMDREQSAKRIYDRKVKEAAKELTDLQAQLVDMNIALDSFSSAMTRQQLQKEAAALRERNESVQNHLETLFGDRQLIEERNKQLEQEIEIEKNKINDMILGLPVDEQARYKELQSLAEDLKTQNTEMHNKIDTYTKQKDRLNEIVMSSQIRMEAVQLQQKLKELVAKRDNLREEEQNKLTPEQEREKLITDVRSNNQALTSISHQMKLIEDQLAEKKEQLQLIEQDLEEGNSERHEKYKELKRRDETMTAFLESYPQQMEEEKKNVELLKNQITYAVEQITLQGIDMKKFGMSNADLLNEKIDLNSQGGLMKEYKRLAIQLKQLQLIEKRTNDQLKQLMEKEAALINDIKKYSDLELIRAEAAENYEELSSKLEELKNKKRVTIGVVEEARKRCQEIKEHLRSNETYRQLSHLEEKLVDLMRENKTLQEVVELNRKENDYTKVRSEVEDIVGQLIQMLADENNKNLKKSAI